MLGSTILPLVSEPIVRVGRDTFSIVAGHQLLQIANPHTAANNLTNTRNKDIDTLSKVGSVFQSLHVEGLECLGEVDKHDGLVDLVGHLSLSGLGNVIAHNVVLAVFSHDAVFVEVLDGITVIESDKRTLRRNKFGVKGLDDLGSNRIGEKGVNDLADLKKKREIRDKRQACTISTHHVFDVVKQVLELDEHQLGFEVSVLGQMSAKRRLSHEIMEILLTFWSNSSQP